MIACGVRYSPKTMYKSFCFYLKVKLKAMKSNEDKVEKMNAHGTSLIKRSRSTEKVKSDMEAFNTRWETTFSKYSESYI